MRAGVRPVKVRFRDVDLRADVVRGVGFRFECACGVAGRTRPTYREAANELMRHRHEHRTSSAGAPRAG